MSEVDQTTNLIEKLEECEGGQLVPLTIQLFSLCCMSEVPDWIKAMAKATMSIVLSKETE